MTFAFDLISDLHVETWSGKFDWTGKATAPYCVVAGDIAKDREIVIDTLRHLGQCYQAVFYIDGNDEHVNYYSDLADSYRSLARRIAKIPNVVYLQDNVIVIDGVAILGTNGWWGFDFDLSVDAEAAAEWYKDKFELSSSAVRSISKMATTDSLYMGTSIKRLQTHRDVKKIVMVTHTVPDPALIAHDIGLEGQLRMNTMGNRLMMQALALDTEHKIDTWCFGHYHGSVDQVRSGVRFVNNCKGRGDTKYSQHVYYPRRIVIDY
jgi:predicted phosphodiesterase